MPPHPQEPHLFVLKFDGREIAVVRAMSVPECRDYVLEQRLAIEKLSPSRAFQLAARGDLSIDNAKPEYADPDDSGQIDLFVGGHPVKVEFVPLSSIVGLAEASGARPLRVPDGDVSAAVPVTDEPAAEPAREPIAHAQV